MVSFSVTTFIKKLKLVWGLFNNEKRVCVKETYEEKVLRTSAAGKALALYITISASLPGTVYTLSYPPGVIPER